MNSWRPDRESHIPLYLQIEQHIKEKILHGEWTIGTKIPSQRKLAEELQVNRSTVTATVDELIAQGLLEGKRGEAQRSSTIRGASWRTAKAP